MKSKKKITEFIEYNTIAPDDEKKLGIVISIFQPNMPSVKTNISLINDSISNKVGWL